MTDCPFAADYIHLTARAVRDNIEELFGRLNTADERLVEAELDGLATASNTLIDILEHFNTPKLRVVK